MHCPPSDAGTSAAAGKEAESDLMLEEACASLHLCSVGDITRDRGRPNEGLPN